MKTILGIIAVAAFVSTAAMAESKIQDLSYGVPAGKTKVSLGVSLLFKGKEKTYRSTNQTVAGPGYTNKATEWALVGDYGVTDKFTLGASWNYLHHYAKRDDMGTATKAKGFSDPTIRTSYAYYAEGDIGAGAFLNITPSVVKAVTGGTGAATFGSYNSNYPGNPIGSGYMSGGSTNFTLGTGGVYTKDSSEFGFAPFLTYRGKAKYTAVDRDISGNKQEVANEVTSYTVFGADLNVRHHYNPTWYAQAGATVVGPSTSTYSSTSTTTTSVDTGIATTVATPTTASVTEYSVPFHATPKVTLGYKCPETKILVELSGMYDNYNIGTQSKSSTGSANAPANTTEYSHLMAGLNFSYEL